MTLMEQWDQLAKEKSKNEKMAQQFWLDYYAQEKEVYAKMLAEPDKVYEGTVQELADEFGMSTVYFGAFLDGINESIKEPNPVDQIVEDSHVKVEIDPEKLYYNMVANSADWLYKLPEWDNILTKERQAELYKQQKQSKIVRRKGPKIGRNDPCPCGSGKKYKFCCGR